MIGSYLVDDVVIRRHGTKDQWGEPGATTDQAVKGYVEYGTKLVRDLKGEEVVSSASVLLAFDPTLTHEDKLVFDGVEHSIIAIQGEKDFSNVALKVFVA